MFYEANYILALGDKENRKRVDSDFYAVDKDSFLNTIETIENDYPEMVMPLQNVMHEDKEENDDLMLVEFWSGKEDSENKLRNQVNTWAFYYSEEILNKIKAEFK